MTTHKLTKANHPECGERVWLWRNDNKHWVVERMSTSIIEWLDHPALAYTHWAELVEPPKPEG